MTFSLEDIPNLAGKVAIVTGANAGLGKVSAFELARKGCHVILACRSKERTEPVIEQIKKQIPSAHVEFQELDLNSLSSISQFSRDFHARNLPLHILLNNAGASISIYTETKDGIEAQFGSMHVGHFYLTHLLLDVLEASAPSRVVMLSSMMHSKSYPEGIRFDKINSRDDYAEFKAYGQAKLCNLLFARELGKRVGGRGVFVNAAHPGWVATEMRRDHMTLTSYLIKGLTALFATAPEKGALTQLFLATSPRIEEEKISGKYFVPVAKEAEPSKMARDDELAEKLWDYTVKTIQDRVPDFTPRL